jgi:ABC-type sugar transport system ATPase subunit
MARNGAGLAVGESVTLGVRPEDFRVLSDGSGQPSAVQAVKEAIEGRLVLAERLGAETLAHVALEAASDAAPVIIKIAGDLPAAAPGAPLRLAIDPDKCHLFAAQGTAIRETRPGSPVLGEAGIGDAGIGEAGLSAGALKLPVSA